LPAVAVVAVAAEAALAELLRAASAPGGGVAASVCSGDGSTVGGFSVDPAPVVESFVSFVSYPDEVCVVVCAG
jgi:hypothetical protein